MAKQSTSRRGGRRALAISATAALTLTAFAAQANAADSVYPQGEYAVRSAQPINQGHRLQDVRDWSPETDPYAQFMRADIPLQPRIGHNSATQADPKLDGKSQIMLMQGDYGNSFFENFRANNDANEHTLQFWQYADYWSPWHGSASLTTPKSLYDPKSSDWRKRGFEFGIVDIPNPAWTNAAHRNGVKSIATIYFDPAFRPALTLEEAFEPGNKGYIVAQKLIEMAKFYGYDGYFLNDEETNFGEQKLKPFMKQLTDAGLYTQWYTNTGSQWDSVKAEWTGKGAKKVMDSVFLNYGWDESSAKTILGQIAQAKDDPFAQAFFGVEANQAKFQNLHPTAKGIRGLYVDKEKNHSPRASIALFTPSDFYQRDVLDANDGPKMNPLFQQAPFQWVVDGRQRLYFSGPTMNPASAEYDAKTSYPDLNANDITWPGVADFVPARSVISGSTFATNFSIGKGLSWWNGGKVTNSSEWSNMDSQALLPSWQWWTTGGGKLTADWDMGKNEKRSTFAGKPATIPFAAQGAYEGGNSLAIHGDTANDTVLNLFKTDLSVKKGSALELTFKKVSADAAPASVVLTLKGEKEPVILPLDSSKKAGEWTTAKLSLKDFAGKTVTSIGLKFGEAKGYQLNLGKLAVTDGRTAPAAPTGVEIRGVYDDGQLVLGWDKAKYGDVVNYRVSAVTAKGTSHLFDGFTDLAYIKDAPNRGKVTYQVQAVGKDGQLSAPTPVVFNGTGLPTKLTVDTTTSKINDLTFAAKPREVTVHWEGADAGKCTAIAHLQNRSADKLNTFSTTVDCAKGVATIPVPFLEGYTADVTVVPQGKTIGYTTRVNTHDGLAAPMPASDLVIKENGEYRFKNPTTRDWYKLVVSFKPEGGEAKVLRQHVRGGTIRTVGGADATTEDITVFRALPAATGTVIAELTDYAGNTTTQEFTIKDYKVTGMTPGPEAEPVLSDFIDVHYPPIDVTAGGKAQTSAPTSATGRALPKGTTFTSKDLPAFLSLAKDGTLSAKVAGDTKLASGSYEATIVVTFPDKSEKTIKVQVKLTVPKAVDPAPTTPADPTPTAPADPTPTAKPEPSPTASATTVPWTKLTPATPQKSNQGHKPGTVKPTQPDSSQDSQAPSGELSRTGASSGAMALAGLVAVIAGAVLVVRKRQMN
ncbi:Rib/alpha-like domain-containing protein [Arcanobacterium canis]|uniref:Rib/alpha-like domain-containing protein n=1 Tax=Arcanobacterium canis TaxID=999183 RepID=A0ABY8FY27_9ACTO|nr:Rib/alpha-like domain-containing protein [Arcanobacterium canis]WFM83423.1 Rib/alpha-like domain-containing protein [Arcanobacterium canis]